MRGWVFLGVITSSISRWESMGLIMTIADVTADRNIPATNLARFPFI